MPSLIRRRGRRLQPSRRRGASGQSTAKLAFGRDAVSPLRRETWLNQASPSATSSIRQKPACNGHPAAFVIAVLIILAWALTGPIFGFSDTWQLVINTSTTIVTFLMVFLIQNT